MLASGTLEGLRQGMTISRNDSTSQPAHVISILAASAEFAQRQSSKSNTCPFSRLKKIKWRTPQGRSLRPLNEHSSTIRHAPTSTQRCSELFDVSIRGLP